MILTGITLFYAGINLGFESRDYTEMNSAYWLDACFYYLTELKIHDNSSPASGQENGFHIPMPINDYTSVPDTIINEEFPDDEFIMQDSLMLQDTTLLADTVFVDPLSIDSTARIEHFRYRREDKPYVTLDRKKTSAFYARPGSKTRTIEIDSTGNFVTIKETVAGQQTKILLQMTMEDYIAMRMAIEERKTWENIGYAYEMKQTTRDLGGLIKDITDFEIPLPSVGVLSIFGDPKISLKIQGAVDIHGAWRTETTEGVTASRFGNTRNEPDFKQQVQINVNGTIGDKLNISADWNTERTFEYENQLKIKYTGYEDEIIQSIEAGNVSLQTSPLVGGSEALFGVKALFKMGPLSLTTLASQKKGEIKEVSVSGGSTSQTFEIRAWNYSENNFFLDERYASTEPDENYFYRYYSTVNHEYDPTVEVVDIEVWKSTFTQVQDKQRERFANAFIDLPGRTTVGNYPDSRRQALDNPVPGEQETGRFILLTQDVDYKLHPKTGYITLLTNVQELDVIAVAYRVQGATSSPDDDVFFGEFRKQVPSDTSRLVLKLVKPKNLQPRFELAWRLQLRNIYYLGGRDIKPEGFDFKVRYAFEGQGDPVEELVGTDGQPVRLLQAFGLDRFDANGQSNPDGVFDWNPGITVLPQSGEIIFPVLEPFGSDLPDNIPDTLAFGTIYQEQKVFAQQNKLKDKWLLTGQYSGSVSSRYNLGFNIVENSVKVILNGQDLVQGVDYTVDYNVGQLIIRNDAALVPGANLRITYEQNELFSLASKTMLGARGIVDFSRKTKLGFSMLNLNQQTLQDKVRIGEEPLSNTIYGVDFSTSGDLPFMTKLLDNVISTRQMSGFSLSGEYAYINPDPNTKKSNIASDMNRSIAYIDDFEGSKTIISVGIGYTGWKDISVPDQLPYLPETLTKRQLMDYKAKSFWFTQSPSNVQVSQIWGERKRVAKADEYMTIMDYVYIPDTPGTYNYYPNLVEPHRSWGGIMKMLSSVATNLIQENIEFIEFWAQVNTNDPNARVYLDLGRISEDVIPNRELDTEDRNGNDAIDEGEDTGLDGLFDANEGNPAFNDMLTEPVTRPDPSGDNFRFSGSAASLNIFDYFNINGTEGNAVLTDMGRYPDTEDLNRNGQVDLVNSYFRYEVPLDTNPATNPYIAGGGEGYGWYLYRVPVREYVSNIGNADLTTVEMIRLLVTGTNEMVHLRFAEFNLVGNQWRRVEILDTATGRAIDDSVFTLSVINYEDNLNYYRPEGVVPERDRTRPDEEIFRNEQSLNLIVQDLPVGDQRSGVKFLVRPLDIFNYSEMKLFVHGDLNNTLGSVSHFDGINYSADVFFRFGGDSNNYYEYRQPVVPGWNEISIIFSQLTAIKQARGDSINQTIKFPVPGNPEHFYVVRGNPSLTSIKYLQVGVFNRSGETYSIPISGEVWVNELRVIGADDSPGWAYSLSSSLKLADLLNVNFNMSQTSPSFHRIADRFGSRVDARNWSMNADLDVLKLIPLSLPESNLKLNYSHTESVGKPVYVPGTDIRVDQAAQQLDNNILDTLRTIRRTGKQLITEAQSVNISDTWAVPNIRLRIPSSHWLIRDTFNALSFGFSYNKTFVRNPTILSNRAWVWNAQMNYALNLSPDYSFSPVDVPVLGTVVGLFSDYSKVKVYYLPQTYTITVNSRRNKATSINRPQGIQPSSVQLSRDFTAQRSFGFNWKMTEGGFLNITTNYNFDISSSLLYLETDAAGLQRKESQIWSDILSGSFFGKDYLFRQNLDIKTAPRLPTLWDLNRHFTISAGYSVNYQWNNDFRQEELGRSAAFANKTSVGLTIRLKNLTAPLFAEETQIQKPLEQPIRGRTSQAETDKDTLSTAQDTTAEKGKALTNALLTLRAAVKYVFFDYDNITINFSNDNNLGRGGIRGRGTGLKNFWGIGFDEIDGPSRLFMLGLSPNVGSRAANGNFTDNFRQGNNLDFRTSRPLWEGAKVDLNWKVGWSMNKSTTIRSDEFGNTSISSITSTGTLNRTFLSVPPVLIFSMFKNGIGKVNELYNPNAPDPNASLSDAFTEGFETLPLLSNLGFLNEFAKYIPRPNWRLTWDGLEKFALFKSAKRVSLDHAYTSTYTEGWKITPDGSKETQTQRIEYGFAPLVGLNLTFGDVWGGNLNASLKYNARTAYDLGVSTRNITETFSRDIGITAGYQKSGFELPLFGLALKNDIEFSFSYTNTRNASVLFNMNQFTEAGTPQDGTTRTTMEPRIKYTISSRVTLAIFYRRSSQEPEGASRIPPTTTNEAGLDVHIIIRP
jgi:cell surface protein SprA